MPQLSTNFLGHNKINCHLSLELDVLSEKTEDLKRIY